MSHLNIILIAEVISQFVWWFSSWEVMHNMNIYKQNMIFQLTQNFNYGTFLSGYLGSKFVVEI
jgi:hypothetical protein